MKKSKMLKEIENEKARSAWKKGVLAYAYDLIEGLEDNTMITKESLLNGAENWEQYSYGGCALIYSSDIAIRLCNNSELIRTDNGRLNPNSSENWLDCQARALYQACQYILSNYKYMTVERG